MLSPQSNITGRVNVVQFTLCRAYTTSSIILTTRGYQIVQLSKCVVQLQRTQYIYKSNIKSERQATKSSATLWIIVVPDSTIKLLHLVVSFHEFLSIIFCLQSLYTVSIQITKIFYRKPSFRNYFTLAISLSVVVKGEVWQAR